MNAAGLALIKRWEGCRLKAYQCSAATKAAARLAAGNVPSSELEHLKQLAAIWTIGYGHTRDVREGQTITQHQADTILEVDAEEYDRAVTRLAPNANANQHGALLSFAFNLGVAALERSTLLKKFLAGDGNAAAEQFGNWVFSAGTRDPGLVARREAERTLFCTPVT